MTQRRKVMTIQKFTYGASWNYYTPSQELALQGSPRASDVLYCFGPSHTHGRRCALCLSMFLGRLFGIRSLVVSLELDPSVELGPA